ncbi:MAG TPA: hypothetical protein PK887_03470 [Ignavibacteriales bacterium]|nr:hypothetical protein [Ignavibacteriales bacterium]
MNSYYPIFLTSIPPFRLDVIYKCISTWKDYAKKIISLNPIREIDTIKNTFDFVEIIPIDDTNKYVPIDNFLKLIIDDPNNHYVIINADIAFFNYTDNEWNKFLYTANNYDLTIASRHDYSDNIFTAIPYKYGFDFFLLNHNFAKIIPRTNFYLGCVAWDYLFQLIGIINNKKILSCASLPIYHLKHLENWDKTFLYSKLIYLFEIIYNSTKHSSNEVYNYLTKYKFIFEKLDKSNCDTSEIVGIITNFLFLKFIYNSCNYYDLETFRIFKNFNLNLDKDIDNLNLQFNNLLAPYLNPIKNLKEQLW